jgi:hypothetical protein
MSKKSEARQPKVDAHAALLDEMRIWVRIVAEHLKFHRGGLDPNIEQDDIFRKLDKLARKIDIFYSEIINCQSVEDVGFDNLFDETLNLITRARNLQANLYEGINNCEILSILPEGDAGHMLRETERFLGSMGRMIGRPAPTREQLGIPGGDIRVQAIPRMLITEQPRSARITDILEEIMFFSRVHGEHAKHIAMTVRPGSLEDIRQQALSFERKFMNIMERATAVEEAGRGVKQLVNRTGKLLGEWKAFLCAFVKDAATCGVFPGLINTWPLQLDHFIRETDYVAGLLEQFS